MRWCIYFKVPLCLGLEIVYLRHPRYTFSTLFSEVFGPSGSSHAQHQRDGERNQEARRLIIISLPLYAVYPPVSAPAGQGKVPRGSPISAATSWDLRVP